MELEKIVDALGDNANKVITKAGDCKNTDELMDLAKVNGILITTEDAEEILKLLSPRSGELSDDELDVVAGGYDKDETPCRGGTQPICVAGCKFLKREFVNGEWAPYNTCSLGFNKVR